MVKRLQPDKLNNELLIVLADLSTAVSNAQGLRHHTDPQMPAFHVGSDGDNTQWKAYLSFDISVIPRNSHIQSAHLQLSSSQTPESNGIIEARPIAEAWDTTHLAWVQQPETVDVDTLSSKSATKPNGDLSVDIAPMVRRWMTHRRTNRGLVLQTANPNQRFWSVFHSTTQRDDFAPRIVVHYLRDPNDQHLQQ